MKRVSATRRLLLAGLLVAALTPWGPTFTGPEPAVAAVWLPTGTWAECHRWRPYWTGSRYIADIWRNGQPMTVVCRRTVYGRPW